MENTLLLIAGLFLAFIVGLFTSKKETRTDAKILDLTTKIKGNQDAAAKAQADADQKIKEYNEALQKLDPDFHNNDDDGKPSS